MILDESLRFNFETSTLNNFFKVKKVTLAISLILILASLVWLFVARRCNGA